MHNHIRQEPGRPTAAHRDARAAPLGTGPRHGARAPAVSAEPLGWLARAALHAAGLGWPVFPVRPRAKVPAITGWEDAATTDPDQITEWWLRAWNIGLATGKAGLLVVDLDRDGRDPPREWAGVHDGAEVLARLAAAAGEPLPVTYTVVTPSGGRHLYFHQPNGATLRNTQGALGWCIDTRGHGGYVLAAGSRLTSGSYRELRRPVAQLPGWLAAALTPRPESDSPATTSLYVDELALSGWRAQAYLRAVVEGERRNVTAALVGQRHRTLLRAARRLGQWVGGGALTAPEARAVLTDAANHFLGVEGYTARQVDRDITDGLAYGTHRPRHLDRFPHRVTDE
ncbi:bifunctional DNA primase/polymerase [Pseudonocardia sp. KRD-169]|uniref:Bifunctional DNA primase/polymerase n=1 Tax=Pseudonocardia abyssalis TaxID=2792008 RepID=A0ABS6UM16_9PSEU|nr:bifunctional DNA primase/polymerase [Pseudonocardia abyssalis]MBW0133276.1 bifunctional DNA primase/polymerase [Pseudonocardia abyssalis]